MDRNGANSKFRLLAKFYPKKWYEPFLQSVPSPNVVRLWAMVLLIGGERGKDLMRSKNGRLRGGEFVSIVSWSM